MRQKKNSKIILNIIILFVILILLTGIAYVYFGTDTFKSNKNLFFKYVLQIEDEENGFIEAQLKEYFEKQKITPYIDNGSMSVNITAPAGQKQFENANNMNITFNGQVDTASSQTIQNASLNYSNNVKFPLSYKQIGNTVGVQTNYIGSKYVAINKNKLHNLENNLTLINGITDNITFFEKLQEFTNVSLAKTDLQHIKDIYLNVLNDQLLDNNFSKIEETNIKGYKLTLNAEEFKNLVIKLLDILKNDQATLDKINEYLKIYKKSFKITASSIDNLIKDINNNSKFYNENLEITVYQTKGKINRFIFKVNEIELKLEKTLIGSDQQYNIILQINYNNQIEKIDLITRFSGLETMQNITENHELILETEKMKYQYYYNNNVKFTDSINIEAYSNNNSLRLDEINNEEKNTLLNAINQRLQNVNKNQMTELGLEENENPLQYVIPQFGIYSSTLGIVGTSNISEEEVNTFNNKFENYESTNLQGVTVKGLLSTIQLNNESQENNNRKIKEIHFDGQEYEVTDQNITLIKSSVEIETAYRVELERDEDTGLIYRAVINKK